MVSGIAKSKREDLTNRLRRFLIEKWNRCEVLYETSFRKTVVRFEALVCDYTLVLRNLV